MGGKPVPYCGTYATENGMERSVAYRGIAIMVGINSTLGMPRISSSTLPGQQVVSRSRTSYPGQVTQYQIIIASGYAMGYYALSVQM